MTDPRHGQNLSGANRYTALAAGDGTQRLCNWCHAGFKSTGPGNGKCPTGAAVKGGPSFGEWRVRGKGRRPVEDVGIQEDELREDDPCFFGGGRHGGGRRSAVPYIISHGAAPLSLIHTLRLPAPREPWSLHV